MDSLCPCLFAFFSLTHSQFTHKLQAKSKNVENSLLTSNSRVTIPFKHNFYMSLHSFFGFGDFIRRYIVLIFVYVRLICMLIFRLQRLKNEPHFLFNCTKRFDSSLKYFLFHQKKKKSIGSMKNRFGYSS